MHGLIRRSGPAPLKGPYDPSGLAVGCKVRELVEKLRSCMLKYYFRSLRVMPTSMGTRQIRLIVAGKFAYLVLVSRRRVDLCNLSGAFTTLETCPKGGVAFYDYFSGCYVNYNSDHY
jgi:hypothetical protein